MEKYKFTTLFALVDKGDKLVAVGIVYEDKCYIQGLYSLDG